MPCLNSKHEYSKMEALSENQGDWLTLWSLLHRAKEDSDDMVERIRKEGHTIHTKYIRLNVEYNHSLTNLCNERNIDDPYEIYQSYKESAVRMKTDLEELVEDVRFWRPRQLMSLMAIAALRAFPYFL